MLHDSSAAYRTTHAVLFRTHSARVRTYLFTYAGKQMGSCAEVNCNQRQDPTRALPSAASIAKRRTRAPRRKGRVSPEVGMLQQVVTRPTIAVNTAPNVDGSPSGLSLDGTYNLSS